MVIQIERISAQSMGRSVRRCKVPQCTAPATWFLVDRDMPESHEASMGERACCTAHITATYLNLRGAHIVAQALPTVQALPAARIRVVRRGVDRRRTRPYISTSSGNGNVYANGNVHANGSVHANGTVKDPPRPALIGNS